MKKEKITRKQLIKKYIEFFKSKNHKEIQNSSLIPENDPTVLFTTAGMHPLVPYLLGHPHPQGKRLVNVQKCIRTQDINEVGDDVHLTFFEMLGNWSLGDYFKKDAIKYSFEFLTNIICIPINKLSVTCFKGDENASKDEESAKIWENLGIDKSNIKFLGKNDNWWGPAGKTGPCGPDTEMFVNNCEIWNDVFMQYNKTEKGDYNPLKQKNVDTGMGVERTLAILNNEKSVYETETFLPIIRKIEKLSSKKYNQDKDITKSMRIIADHIKASVMIIANGITASNIEQGYVLRRLIRRAIRYGRKINLKNFTKQVAEPVFEIYKDYEHLKTNKNKILKELEKEENKFLETLEKGIKFLNKIIQQKKQINCKDAFLLYQSYGFPIEMTIELANEKNIKVDEKGFEKECKIHQELSKTATKGKFKSGLADSSEQTTKLHTATHLLLTALKKVLKDKNIQQKGSNITPERLRLDFNFDRKLTEEEIKKVEGLVNKQINKSIPITCEIMNLEQARKQGAEGIFDEKYKDKISVYSIGGKDDIFSKEICSGPHVSNTSELGTFKIKKEESSSAGVRRIKGVLE